MFDVDSSLLLHKQRREQLRQEVAAFHFADEARAGDPAQDSERQRHARKALVERLIDFIILLP
jgi:hypothetical protein